MTPLKTLSTGLAVAALGAGLAASTPASANPGAVIAGVIGGVAVGAMIAGAANAADGPYGYYPAQPVYPPAPVYTPAPAYRPAPAYEVAPAYQPADDEDDVVYAPRCRVVQRPVYDDWGRFVGYRPGRRCR